ncbi:MAG: sigma-54-dependent Fis family transcriptional regulator [Nitrospirota bacterium]|nr:MAG: sigma-54-dependent Fis family transcriptional regulator [Nitrospirota bacterium]
MSLNILVVPVGNSDHWPEVIKYLGRENGMELHVIYKVSEVYNALDEHSINIVIAEYSIPRINTNQFIKRVKKQRPSVEIILLSDTVQLSKAIEAMKAGAYDIYEFPVDMKLLLTIIGKAVEKQSLYLDREKLKEKVEGQFDLNNIVGRSKSIQHVINIARTVAKKNASVLITGETGTGKEMIAEFIHNNSFRSGKPFVAVNCGAFNEGVLESELFGHEKGAFTGAIASRVGRFELANGGTIFLDEIGDLTHSTQIRLLRVLQERRFERVGGNNNIVTDARIIAATNRDLRLLIEEGKFREDLYYRLNVVHISVPPLRGRKEDIPLLVSHFINKFNEREEYGIEGIASGAMQLLMDYSWPGNVRELENTIESAMAMSQSEVIEEKYLPSFLHITPPEEKKFYRISSSLTMKQVEDEIIRLTLEKTSGNKTKAARLLGIGLRTMQRKTGGYNKPKDSI